MALFVDKRINGAINIMKDYLEVKGVAESDELITETVKHYAKLLPNIKVPQLAAVSICNFGDNTTEKDVDKCMAIVFKRM